MEWERTLNTLRHDLEVSWAANTHLGTLASERAQELEAVQGGVWCLFVSLFCCVLVHRKPIALACLRVNGVTPLTDRKNAFICLMKQGK